MNAQEILELVRSQIGDAWDTTNAHSVDLRKSLVSPTPITVIDRTVRDGKIDDRLEEAWLVLIEKPQTMSGYRIVAKPDGTMFGLASEGLPSDRHPVLCGWYGDFWDTFRGM